MGWEHATTLSGLDFVCWCCGKGVAPSIGYRNLSVGDWYIGICPRCDLPTFLIGSKGQIPSPPYGNSVSNVPDMVNGLYNEARNCMSISAYTAAALACRKILMSVAVHLGAKGSKSFAFYVDYLDEHHYIAEGSKQWVDYIRAMGNEATHEIPSISRTDAERSIAFAEMLLKIVFEFPAALHEGNGASG